MSHFLHLSGSKQLYAGMILRTINIQSPLSNLCFYTIIKSTEKDKEINYAGNCTTGSIGNITQ